MTAKNLAAPRFRPDQKVGFIGGTGVIKNYQPESGTWFYWVEMEMGPEPEVGRIGYETTVRLFEADLTLLGSHA